MLYVFKPESIRVSDALKLLLDDFTEQWPRTVIRLQHATHVEVHVVLQAKKMPLCSSSSAVTK